MEFAAAAPFGILYTIPAMEISEQALAQDADNELVCAFRDGDQSSFDELVRRYKGRVYRIAYAMVQDANEADDIAQEVFLKVYYKIRSFRGESSFFTWLYSITVNEARHSLRKRKKGMVSLDTPLSEDEGARLCDILRSPEKTPESQLVQREQAAWAQRLINSLPEKYRDVYILRNIEGLSYNEISSVMHISLDKVKVWLFRARERLDKELKPLYEQV